MKKTDRYISLILDYLKDKYTAMRHEPVAQFRRPYLIMGKGYEDCLWDWDSFFSAQAIWCIMNRTGADDTVRESMVEAMEGGILNFFDFQLDDGALPICVYIGGEHQFQWLHDKLDHPHMHKPIMAQYINFLVTKTNDLSWIEPKLPDLARFHELYEEKYRDPRTGLYFWRFGSGSGVDNDPCTFGRPRNSSADVYLNCLFVKEFEEASKLFETAGEQQQARRYRDKWHALSAAINRYCWDRRDRFYYTQDLQCETNYEIPWLNKGMGVFWKCLPLRIRSWNGFMPLWAGVPTHDQARELVTRHLTDYEALGCDYGIRTLAANEPMYNLHPTSNPSNWLGPVWMIPNYITFRGLVDYGFHAEAKEFCEKVITLLGRDIEHNGDMHEYYVPETGEGIINKGFLNWNFLVANMIEVYETI